MSKFSWPSNLPLENPQISTITFFNVHDTAEKNQFQYYLDELGKYALFSNHVIFCHVTKTFQTYVPMYDTFRFTFENVPNESTVLLAPQKF